MTVRKSDKRSSRGSSSAFCYTDRRVIASIRRDGLSCSFLHSPRLVHPVAGHPDREASLSLLFLRAPKAPPPGFAHTEEPIRAELFSVERLEHHGETLAVAQRVTAYPGLGRPM